MHGETALEVRGLTRRYGARYAVQSLDLTVQTGDVYGFLGPNGAGKTTAMRAMVGLITRDAGTVKIFGEADEVRSRRHLGAIIETPALHSWLSGRDNLRQACAYANILTGAEKEIDRVLERVGLTERAKDASGNYSLGMKQRLAIARALLGKPKLLLLDEPTNGLDPGGMREMRDLVRSLALNDALTVLISSHLLAEVQAICNRVGIIHAGTLRIEGNVSDLLAGASAAVVEIGTSDRAALDVALGEIEGLTVMGAGAAGRVRVGHGTMPLAQLNRELVGKGVPVEALVPAARSLEDVFMEVTS